jgi:O-antigen ligase
VLALAVCGLVGFWPEMALRRVLTTGSLLALFLAIYQMSSRVSVSELLRLFFITAAVYSLYILGPFVASGGGLRSFGLYGVLFDDQAMVALPIGVALTLTARPGRAPWYFAGVVFVFGGLLATQSRAPIAFALAASAFVLLAAIRRKTSSPEGAERLRTTRRRAWGLVGGIASALIVVVAAQPDLFLSLADRFDELFSAEAQGTTVYRLALWKRAILTFLDYPIFGTGPGGFYRLSEIYATLHLTPDFPYLRTLGAHNVLLHYLADTGLVGGLGLVALTVNLFRWGRRNWQRGGTDQLDIRLALYGWAFLFVLSTLVEASWMWGQLSFLAVFMAALISRRSRSTA